MEENEKTAVRLLKEQNSGRVNISVDNAFKYFKTIDDREATNRNRCPQVRSAIKETIGIELTLTT